MTYQDQKQVLCDVLRLTADIANSRGWKVQAGELLEELAHLKGGELFLVVCGECKRGKSTLINAFLEEPDLCPADAPVATNVVTLIRYAEAEKITVHLTLEGGKTELKIIDRSQIGDYASEQGNSRNASRVGMIEIATPNPKLKDGLVIIDTPGVGSLNVEHTEATYRFIPYADAVLFVASANENLTAPELAFAERVFKHTTQVLHVVTKRDQIATWKTKLRDNLLKLNTVLDRPEVQLDGLAVSSVLKLAYLEDMDADLLGNSGFPELESRIWDFLGLRGDLLLGRAQCRCTSTIMQLELPLRSELAALEATSEEELAALDQELRGAVSRVEELSENSAGWNLKLQRQIDNLSSDSQNHLSEQFKEIRQNLREYLQQPEYLRDPERLGDVLTTETNGSVALVLKEIDKQLAAITSDIRRSTSLVAIEAVQGPGELKQNYDLTGIHVKRDSFLQKSVTAGKTMAMTTMGLARAGTLAGSILGGLVGSVAPGAGTLAGMALGAQWGGGLASLIGTVFGVKRGISDLAEKDLAALRQNLDVATREQLAAAERSISQEVGKIVRNARFDIQQSLQREIQRDLKACKEATAGIGKARQQRDKDTSQRKLALSNDLKRLENLQKRLESMRGPVKAEGASL